MIFNIAECATRTFIKRVTNGTIRSGTKVGVVGICGPGHMAIKIANAMGAEVTAITAHKNKSKDAMGFRAKHILLSADKNATSTKICT